MQSGVSLSAYSRSFSGSYPNFDVFLSWACLLGISVAQRSSDIRMQLLHTLIAFLIICVDSDRIYCLCSPVGTISASLCGIASCCNNEEPYQCDAVVMAAGGTNHQSMLPLGGGFF